VTCSPTCSCRRADAEIEHEQLQQIVERVLASPARAGRTRVLVIDGRTGAGKTTLARELAPALAAPIVELEQLYPGWDGLQQGVDLLVSAVLEPLAEGQPVQVPRYDWVAGRYGEPWTLEPPDLLIVEGVGAGSRTATRFASLLVWLELAAETRRERALARDGDLFRPHWAGWTAQEEALLAREATPSRADLVLDMN
jgi:pantothenate kinase-related protein Tda10